MMRNRNTIAVLVAGLTLAFGAHAGKPVKQDASEGAYAGVRVAIDPATGRLRQPSAAEVSALRTAVRQSGAQPTFKGQPRTEAEAYQTIRRLKDGSVMAMVPDEKNCPAQLELLTTLTLLTLE